MRKSLRTRLTVYFIALVLIPLIVVGAIGTWQSYNTQVPQALDAQSQVAKRVAEQVKNFIQDREYELRALADVRGLSSATLEEQTGLLSNLFSTQALYEELILVNSRGRELVHLSRVDIITAQNLGSLAGLSEFETPKENRETHYGAVSFDELTGEPFMVISIPVINLQTDELAYVLIGNFRFKAIWEVMAQADVIGSGIVYMIDHDGLVLAHANPSVVLQGTRVELPEENAFTAGLSGDNVAMARTHIQLNQQDFDVIAEQPGLEALSSALNNIYLTVGVTLAAMVLAGFLGVLAAGQITNPIGELAETAQLISKGDLTRLPTVNSQDEIGALSTAFRIMTTQLRSTLEGLEQRVAARTRDLATVAEVGTATATILEIDNLLLEVVNLTRERFNLYHSHIYLLDEKGENLVLTAGAGEPGRIMAAEKRSIPLHREQSLVARAAREQKGVIVNDVTQAPDFLPNPLLPDTRSELAVPMIVGGNLIGVFDVQSDQIGRFTDADINIQTTLAAQVATSIQNVRSFEQSKAQADLESLVNTIGQKIQRATTLEDTLQIAIRELGSALGASRVSANIQAARVDDITGEN